MNLYDEIINRREALAVIGLGYVGMPIAVAFSEKVDVIGFDINKEKVELYKNGFDITNEIGDEAISKSNVQFTCDENDLKKALFYIVAVPTPVKDDCTPDLVPLKNACEIVGRNMRAGAVVVFESTVYPGVTEEICTSILEQESGMVSGIDFKIGYSPERINPGDKLHRLDSIIKIVSGMDEDTLEVIAKIYELVVSVGVYKAKSIKVAEAAKVIENAQRDINIAFMNELSIIFNRLDIDTREVLEAANTKWNFLNFYPGLVGGHCIGVDPYYLTYKAEQIGYHSQVILAGRRINDNMGKYVAEMLVKKLIQASVTVNGAKVAILGLTFKENCPDIRNTKVIDIYKELLEYGIKADVVEPLVDNNEAKKMYDIQLSDMKEIKDVDAIVIAVAHDIFKQEININNLNAFYGNREKKVLFDLKGIFSKESFNKPDYIYWSL